MTVRKLISLLTFCLLPGATLSAQLNQPVGDGSVQADFYISAAGNDEWSGRLATPPEDLTDGPFATLERARDAVREMKHRDGGLNKDVLVLIGDGVFPIDRAITFAPEDSGTDEHSITYAAAPGTSPILSIAMPIVGWKRGPGEVWTAKAPGAAGRKWMFRQLFVNDQRRPRARTPNEGFYRIVRAAPKERRAFTFGRGDLRLWEKMQDVEVVLFHDWDISRMKNPAVDEATSTVTFPHPVGYQGLPFTVFNHFDPHQRYYVENALELLDAPGEWYLDYNTGVVSYRPMPGEDMAGAQVLAAKAEQLLLVKGTPREPVRRLNFRGLTFSHAEWPFPAEGFGGVQAGTYGSTGPWKRLPAAIEFTGAANCRFEANTVSHVGATALNFEHGCRGNEIVRNHIFDAGANGITLGETRGQPADPAEVSRDNIIAHNVIHDCGRDYPGSVGIWVGHTDHTVVANNHVHDLPYTGISVGWTWNPSPTAARNNVIEYNHIHHVMETLADGGGIYTLGFQPDMVIRGNLIHDVGPTHGRALSNGMFIDEGSKGFLIEKNVIYSTPDGAFRFNQSQKDWHTFRDNVTDVTPDRPEFPKEMAAKAGPK